MFYVPIILGSVRRNRQSPKAARFMADRMRATGIIETEILDLREYDFPIMEERLRNRDDPPPRLAEFAGKIASADSVVIVTPEYNNGYPGVLKNALDYLLPEFKRKPVGIVTVSAGGGGGRICLAQLRLVMLGMGALPLPTGLAITQIRDSLTDDGTPVDEAYERRAERFLKEFLWYTEAIASQRARETAQSS